MEKRWEETSKGPFPACLALAGPEQLQELEASLQG